MKNVILVFFLSFTVYAQEISNKHQLNIDLQQLLLSDAPRYNIGYGYLLNDKWELNLSLGYGNARIMPINSLNLLYDYGVDYKIVELRPEVKYYYRKKVKTPHFVSLEFSYIHHTDRFYRGSFTYYDVFYRVAYKEANYQRNKIAVTLNYGFDIHFNKEHSFGLTPKLGFGMRQRNVEFSELIEPRIIEKEDDVVIIFPNQIEGDFTDFAGKRFGIDMQFTIKAFYKF